MTTLDHRRFMTDYFSIPHPLVSRNKVNKGG